MEPVINLVFSPQERNRISKLEAEVVRLRTTLGTLIIWLAQGTLSQIERQELLTMLDRPNDHWWPPAAPSEPTASPNTHGQDN